ncbi:GNAT family N-acetyltransferase [Micromonospora sp. A3M-1-15]|uniref:GNAT family N-acetyltransferase n=1 Tax=Micromonospora sp. A3M-1-15 TaxID=2962035 RepID=UPI0020B7187D|nr:GNAT family N-acetyltransferase [Micromonospora sp. A3M-1-15]MCP3782335.1 GNAT family N-acetyltransferase [Micromonospora sp. A3M-1-15]
MPELITPTTRLHRSWLAARDEWGHGVHQDGAGLRPTDDVDSPAGFADWVGRLRDGEDESRLPEGMVPALYWWIVEGDEVLGAISLRLRLNDFLRNAGGHIGYGVRPSARRRGVATFALGAALAEAARRGIDPVLVTCDDGNTASARTIERHGGVLDDVRDTELGRLRRYWIRTR